MKALSIKEPWANLIRSGKKTIETRTWKTNYRGDILLCASKKPTSNISGFAFAIVELIDVRPMKKSHEKKAQCKIYPGAYSWLFKNVRGIRPFPVKGQLGLFEIDYNLPTD